MGMNPTFEEFRDKWSKETPKRIEKEIASLRKYMQKHSAHYAFHGDNLNVPGELTDGLRLMALKEALEISINRNKE